MSGPARWRVLAVLSKVVWLGGDCPGLPEGCGVSHCPLPKLSGSSSSHQALAKQPSSPFSSSYFPPASKAKQNVVLTKNNNRQQIQTMDKPPARARATRILPEEDGIIRRPLRHLSIAAVCGPRRLSDGAAAVLGAKAIPPKRSPSGAGARGGLRGDRMP